MTTEEFKAYCAELAAKLNDGRAMAEAQERLKARRWQREHRPTYEDQLEQDDQEGGIYG